MGKIRGRRAQKEEEKRERHIEQDLKIYDEAPQSQQEEANAPNTFFGLVDSTELDYFKQAEATLNANAFESDEDKAGFVTSVLEESRGKELKLVTNQICSKLMERLILNASDEQLKKVFKSFDGHFVSLIHHKYSSHCVETLLVRTAALIEKELLNPFPQTDLSDEFVSMENLFLFFLNEIRPYLKEMIVQQYASHTLRLIILILAGRELPSTTMSNSTLRSKKSKIARKMIEIADNEDFNRAFQIPSAFKNELKQLLDALKSKIDTKGAREYAIHKIASPVLQLLIQVEGIVDRDRPFWHLVFLKDNDEKDSKEEGFVEYLLSDPVGSHFFENTIKDQRVKYIERLYKLYMSQRVLKLAKRDTTGSYVIQTLLKRLKQNEVREMLDQLIPEMSILMNSNLEMGQSIIDASALHHHYKRAEIIEELAKKYTPKDNESDILESVLQLSSSTLGNTRDDWPTAEERRRSLFLEKLIEFDSKFLNLTVENILSLPKERLIQMCFHGVFSHVVQNVLKPELDIVKRRRLLNQFQGEIVSLSCNAYGSHIVDMLWSFTLKLNMYKERIAKELVDQKEKVKESIYGRLVWKNWKMELYMRKRHDWNFAIKEEEFQKLPPEQPEEKQKDDGKKRKHDEDSQTQKKQKLRGRARK
jgi:nucleolar protein 9